MQSVLIPTFDSLLPVFRRYVLIDYILIELLLEDASPCWYSSISNKLSASWKNGRRL